MRTPPAHPPTTGRESGIALIIVVWLIVVLAVQVGLLNKSLRDGARIVDNTTAIARGEALMHAGLELAVSRLTTGDIRTRWRADGNQRSVDVAGNTLKLTISAEIGRININKAEPELIGGLLRSLDLAPVEAAKMQDRILDWRDLDRARRRSGFDKADNKRAGPQYDPDNPAFNDPSDLTRVLGTSRYLAGLLAQRVTIYTDESGINPRVASREVLYALPGLDAKTVEAAYQLFRMGNDEALTAMAMLAPAQQFLTQALGSAYRIRFEIGGTHRDALGSGEAIVALGLDSALPYRTLSWRFSPSTTPDSESVTDSQGLTR
jgi:general secretion pathway protein K